jgi:hypothetical protein
MGSLAISWNGFLFSSDNLLHILGSVLAVPYFFYFWRKLSQTNKSIYIPIIGAAISWPVLAGDPQLSVILGSIFLLLEIFGKKFSILRATPVFVFSILFSVPQLIPTIFAQLEGNKEPFNLITQTQWSLNPDRLWELFFSGIFGNQPNDFFTGEKFVHHIEFKYPFIFQPYIGAPLLFPLLFFV